MAGMIGNDRSSKRYCVIEKTKERNHFPNNPDSLALKFCTKLAFVLIVNKANPWILGFLVSLVS